MSDTTETTPKRGLEPSAMGGKILVHIPAFVQSPAHLAMVSVQSRLVARLRRYLPAKYELVSALIIDACDPQWRDGLSAIADRFDLVKWSIPVEHGTEWGIRKGTNYAVTAVADEVGATHVLRIIQDTYVFDPLAFAQQIEQAIAITGDWIGASVHHWPTTGHAGLCSQMGLVCDADLRYPNGAVMLAPVQTWLAWYVTMPPNINHYWDDIMMGEAFRQKGAGKFVDWQQSWAHRHGLDEVTSDRVSDAHSRRSRWTEDPPPPSHEMGSIPRLAICAIARAEEDYIGEWIEFHRLVGVERFWIYADDDEGSAMRRKIALHDRGDITLIPWPRTGGSPQMSAYAHFTSHHPHAAEWVAVIDVDEFLYSPSGVDVPTILETYEDVSYHGGVFVNWLFFGDNGHSQRPNGLTIESYTRRGIAGTPNTQGKLIIRMSLQPHFPANTHCANYAKKGLTINEQRSWVPGGDSSPPAIDLLCINHYFHRSQEEAENKCRRPKPPGFETRTAADMARHNLNDIEDSRILRYLPTLREAMSTRSSHSTSSRKFIRLSFVIPTIGRPSLSITLNSLRDQICMHDEVIVVFDGPFGADILLNDMIGKTCPSCVIVRPTGPTYDSGAASRTAGMRMATGDFLAFIDDDDIYLPHAVATIRKELIREPDRPHVFRMLRSPEANELWQTMQIREGNVSTQMFVTPNHVERLGRWTARYAGDFDFIRSTIDLHPERDASVVWHTDIIAHRNAATARSISAG